MFAHLLVPLDGSQLAEAALPSVRALAAKFGSTVTLLRVVRPPDVTTSTVGSAMTEVLSTLSQYNLQEAEAYLREQQRSLRHDVQFVQRRVTMGNSIAQIILDTAASEEVDAIVMSTHGRGGLSRWVFGSVADKVLRQAHVPILLIRSQSQ